MKKEKPKPEPRVSEVIDTLAKVVPPEAPKRRMTHEEARQMPLPARYRTRFFNGGN